MANWQPKKTKHRIADGKVRVFKDTQKRIAARAKASGKSAAQIIDEWERREKHY